MKKNYYYEEAYTGNYEVFMYEDGVLIDSEIIAAYNLGGYIERLEDGGYVFGYPKKAIDEFTKELTHLEEEVVRIKAILTDTSNRI